MIDDLGIILQFTYLIVSFGMLLILIYDHIKDKVNLKRQVQEFYNDIENLLFNFYQHDYYSKYFKNLDEKTKDTFQSYLNKMLYYKEKVNMNFQNYGNYLGLIISRDKRYVCLNMISMTSFGFIFYNTMYNDGTSITQDLLELINKYLKCLRDYWKYHFSKFLIRTNIKSKIDFRKINGFSNPIKNIDGKWMLTEEI